jgi:methionyl-tRNA synthetase
MKLAEEHLSEAVSIESIPSTHLELIKTFKFNEAMDAIFQMVSEMDEFMNLHEPYKKIKDPATADEARADIQKLVQGLGRVAVELQWAMPTTSEQILAAIRENKKPENLFPRI